MNITMDNFFTRFNLAKQLIEKETTMVGTVRLNKRELPTEFASIKEAKKRLVNSSIFCFSDECQLVSYLSNNKKNVCLLSTAHATEELNADTGKPLLVHDYNAHKGGVDTFDKMLRNYTCKRSSPRWPMVIFYNMLDVAALAAYRSYELSHPARKAKSAEKRKAFLKELSMELAHDQLKNRCSAPKVRSSVKVALQLIGFKPNDNPMARQMPDMQINNKRRRCDSCKGTQSQDNKTSGVCDHCLKPTCPLHYVRSCETCYLLNYKEPESHDEESQSEAEEEEAEPTTPTPSIQGENNTEAAKRRRMSIINLDK